jgi:hypothetical protein
MESGRMVAASCLAALAALSVACDPVPSEPEIPQIVQEVAAWRARHEADYRREWVTIAGLHFLNPGAQTAGSSADRDIVLPAAVPAALGTFVLKGRLSGSSRRPAPPWI